jgi:hypothetical protein
MQAVLGHLGEEQLLKKNSGTYNYNMQAHGNAFSFQNLITVYPLFLQILVCALMTANLWLKAQAQLNPVIATVLGNGLGYSYFSIPVIPGVPAGATGVNGLTLNFVVSKILNV